MSRGLTAAFVATVNKHVAVLTAGEPDGVVKAVKSTPLESLHDLATATGSLRDTSAGPTCHDLGVAAA